MRTKISQREARRLKRLVMDYAQRDRRNAYVYSSDYVGGVCLGSCSRDPDWLDGAIKAARQLGRPVIVTQSSDMKTLYFHAVKP